jgi:hypothetical protein
MADKIVIVKPLRTFWYGLYWQGKWTGIVGPYLSCRECYQGLREHGLKDSVPIEFPSLQLNKVVDYLKDNGIVNFY